MTAKKKNALKLSGNMLFIGSHPDDIEFGCAGTICRAVREGHSVHALVMTCGGSGGSPDMRKKEQVKSAGILGLKSLSWADFEDTRLPLSGDVIPAIEKIVRKTKPDYVFVHHDKDTHQDHRYVATSVVAATRNIRNVLFYEGPTSYGFDPNVFVNIDHTIKKKIKALECHESQVMRTNVEKRSITNIAMATATFRGTQCRVSYAEGFRSLRTFLF